MNWIPCNDWNELPVGTWLVKINKERKPYNVAEVADRGEGERIIIVGNHFHWDMGSLVAYTEFEPYDA